MKLRNINKTQVKRAVFRLLVNLQAFGAFVCRRELSLRILRLSTCMLLITPGDVLLCIRSDDKP